MQSKQITEIINFSALDNFKKLTSANSSQTQKIIITILVVMLLPIIGIIIAILIWVNDGGKNTHNQTAL
jgi:hypothetical protein